jgi:hypothetical protein
MKKYYYDVVVSIRTETCRTDSDVICGGFATEDEAMDYINTHDISERDYEYRCHDDETAYIEIEENDTDGNIIKIIAVN